MNAVFVSTNWEKQIDGLMRVIRQVAPVQVNEGSRRSMEIPEARTRKETEAHWSGYVWRSAFLILVVPTTLTDLL